MDLQESIRKIIREEISSIFNEINEGLNNPININLIKDGNDYVGNFIIDDVIYDINIINVGDNSFLYKFTANGSYKLTNDIKKTFSVIPTIQNNVRNFLSEHDPRIFIFFKTDESKSRHRIYVEFINTISDEFNYNSLTKEYSDFTLYCLYNDEVDKDELKNVIMNVIKQNK